MIFIMRSLVTNIYKIEMDNCNNKEKETCIKKCSWTKCFIFDRTELDYEWEDPCICSCFQVHVLNRYVEYCFVSEFVMCNFVSKLVNINIHDENNSISVHPLTLVSQYVNSLIREISKL